METVVEMPTTETPDEPDFEPEHSDAGSDEPTVAGSGQLSFNVGGKRPTSSGLRMVGGKVDVEGSFSKGEIVRLMVEVQVGEVAFVDKTDSKTGQVTACERRHKCRVIGVQRA